MILQLSQPSCNGFIPHGKPDLCFSLKAPNAISPSLALSSFKLVVNLNLHRRHAVCFFHFFTMSFFSFPHLRFVAHIHMGMMIRATGLRLASNRSTAPSGESSGLSLPGGPSVATERRVSFSWALLCGFAFLSFPSFFCSPMSRSGG